MTAGGQGGVAAMETSLEYLADNKTVEILQMENNQDPDEYIRRTRKRRFSALRQECHALE